MPRRPSTAVRGPSRAPEAQRARLPSARRPHRAPEAAPTTTRTKLWIAARLIWVARRSLTLPQLAVLLLATALCPEVRDKLCDQFEWVPKEPHESTR
jgi:hypothetical protein